MAGVALELLVMGDSLSSDPTRGSRSDFPFSRPGRTTLYLIRLVLGTLRKYGAFEKCRFAKTLFTSVRVLPQKLINGGLAIINEYNVSIGIVASQ